MSDRDNIPVLTDLIEKGAEITLSDLGLEDEYQEEVALDTTDDHGDTEIEIEAAEPEVDDDPVERAVRAEADEWLSQHPALEQAIRQILDEHSELALQEIKLAIQRELNK